MGWQQDNTVNSWMQNNTHYTADVGATMWQTSTHSWVGVLTTAWVVWRGEELTPSLMGLEKYLAPSCTLEATKAHSVTGSPALASSREFAKRAPANAILSVADPYPQTGGQKREREERLAACSSHATYTQEQRGTEIFSLRAVCPYKGALDDALLAVQGL